MKQACSHEGKKSRKNTELFRTQSKKTLTLNEWSDRGGSQDNAKASVTEG